MEIDVVRLKDCLDLWSHWMRHDNSRLGYPNKSMGISSGNLSSWDDLSDECDNYTVQIVDAAMTTLREAGQGHMVDAISISIGLLPNNWRYHYNYEIALQFGHQYLWRRLSLAGVV